MERESEGVWVEREGVWGEREGVRRECGERVLLTYTVYIVARGRQGGQGREEGEGLHLIARRPTSLTEPTLINTLPYTAL